MKRLAALATTLMLALVVTGCSDSGSSGGADVQERLDEAQATIASTEAITIALTSSDVPSGVNGVLEADGTGVIEGDLIKFQGDFFARVSGMEATAAVLVIGDDAYMKLLTPDYEPVDFAALGVPNPTAFFAPDTGLASLLGATTDLSEGGEVREEGEILTEITGTLPGEKVEALLHLGGPEQSFEATYGLTEDNELRTIVLSGEFWQGTTSTYSMVLTDYGKVVPIELPE